jgi:outer membrane lipoprotein-sorting protein
VALCNTPSLRWLASVVLLAAGCSSIATLRSVDGRVTVMQIQDRVRTNHERVRTLSGTGNLSVESPEMAGSGSFELTLRKPDSVLLRLEGPFGISVGWALITRTSFLVYNSLENQLISGSTNPANLSRYLRMNVSFDDLLNLFAGGTFFPEDQREADALTVEHEQYLLTYQSPNGSRRYWIDPETLLILKIQHLDATGKLVAEQHYSQYRSLRDVFFPATIRLILTTQRRILSIRYHQIDLNAPLRSFSIDIPPNARRVDVQ